jgi:hypothetical protein
VNSDQSFRLASEAADGREYRQAAGAVAQALSLDFKKGTSVRLLLLKSFDQQITEQA